MIHNYTKHHPMEKYLLVFNGAYYHYSCIKSFKLANNTPVTAVLLKTQMCQSCSNNSHKTAMLKTDIRSRSIVRLYTGQIQKIAST